MLSSFGLACGLVSPFWVMANQDDQQISQTTSDMVPLTDTLRAISEPEPLSASGRELSEQMLRELEHLRATALSHPQDEVRRQAAGQSAWLLGLLYLHGAGVSLSPTKAKQWFTLASHYGDPMASAGLAWCAYEGCQSVPDRVQSQRWARKLMVVDMGRAFYIQWLLERQLRPLHLDNEEGFKSLTSSERSLLEKSVSAGNVHAMIDLGILYAKSHDLRKSLALFEAAAQRSRVAGENAAWVRSRIKMERSDALLDRTTNALTTQAEELFKNARKHHRGDGVLVNYAEAIRLYRQAEAKGSQTARRMLSLIYARTTKDGTIDPVWMRQLSDMDVASLVPKQDVMLAASALRKEPTPLIDLLPNKWQKLID